MLGLAPTAYSVNTVSLRQAITPYHLRGRVNASMRFVMWGTMPIGSLLGGGLAEVIGMHTTLTLAALGMLLGSLWVVFSPVARPWLACGRRRQRSCIDGGSALYTGVGRAIRLTAFDVDTVRGNLDGMALQEMRRNQVYRLERNRKRPLLARLRRVLRLRRPR